MKFTGRCVTIACRDPEVSSTFYLDILGGDIEPDDGGGCQHLKLGDLLISLMPNAGNPSPASFPADAMPIIWLEVDSLEAAREHFERHDWPVEEATDVYLMVQDPDGLYIEITERDDG